MAVDGKPACRAGGANSRDTWALIKAGSSGRETDCLKMNEARGRKQTLKREFVDIYLFISVWLHLEHLEYFYTSFPGQSSHTYTPVTRHLSPFICPPPANYPVSKGISLLHSHTHNDVGSLFGCRCRKEMWLWTITQVHWDLKSTHKLDFLF